MLNPIVIKSERLTNSDGFDAEFTLRTLNSDGNASPVPEPTLMDETPKVNRAFPGYRPNKAIKRLNYIQTTQEPSIMGSIRNRLQMISSRGHPDPNDLHLTVVQPP